MLISILQNLLKCLLITECLELGVAFLTKAVFFPKESDKRNYLVIFLVNLLTNPTANLLSYLAYYNNAIKHLLFIWLLIEISVVLLEGWIFRQFHSCFPKPWLFSFLINMVSALAAKC